MDKITLSTDDQLALFLLYERRNPKSMWKNYIRVLPKVYTQSIFFNEEELNELKGSNLYYLTEKLKQQIRDDYNKLFTEVCEKFPEQFKKQDHSLNDYMWAIASIWSRGFDVEIQKKQTRVLAPFADMFNHNFKADEHHFFDNATNSLCCITHKAFKKGDEVVLNYGSFPNHRLLMLYGFTQTQNPYNYVELWTSMSSEAILYQYKMEVLAQNGVKSDVPFQLHLGKLPDKLLGALRVQRMEPQEFSKVHQAFKGPISEENEHIVLSSLIAAIAGMLKGYSTTIEEDQKILASKPNNWNVYNAVVLRLAEKEILLSNLSILQKLKHSLKP